MIHSLSGGVIADVENLTFVKVVLAGDTTPYWYVSPTNEIEIGDKVKVPFGRGDRPVVAEVVKVEKNVSSQCSPVPMNRIKEIICKVKTS